MKDVNEGFWGEKGREERGVYASVLGFLGAGG